MPTDCLSKIVPICISLHCTHRWCWILIMWCCGPDVAYGFTFWLFGVLSWVFYRITLRWVLVCVLQNVFRRSTLFLIGTTRRMSWVGFFELSTFWSAVHMRIADASDLLQLRLSENKASVRCYHSLDLGMKYSCRALDGPCRYQGKNRGS